MTIPKKWDTSAHDPNRKIFDPYDYIGGIEARTEDIAEMMYNVNAGGQKGTYRDAEGNQKTGYGIPADTFAAKVGISLDQLRRNLPPGSIAYSNRDPKTGKPLGSGFIMQSVACSQKVYEKQVNLSSPTQTIMVPTGNKHVYARPVFASPDIIGVPEKNISPLDEKNPDTVILMPKGYFLTKTMQMKLRENVQKIDNTIAQFCYECLIEKINWLKQKDPSKFIDLRANRLAME